LADELYAAEQAEVKAIAKMESARLESELVARETEEKK